MFLKKQIEACLDDIGVDVVKTGMLASTETITTVAECLAAAAAANASSGPLRLVLDPVMIATTGAALLPSTALRELRERLFPLATVVTPNVPEARLLLKDAGRRNNDKNDGEASAWPVESVSDLEKMARALLTTAGGPQWVLVKGGHTPFRRADLKAATTEEERQVVVDVLVGPSGAVEMITTEWVESRNTHGTGCSLACEWSHRTLFPFTSRKQVILICI